MIFSKQRPPCEAIRKKSPKVAAMRFEKYPGREFATLQTFAAQSCSQP